MSERYEAHESRWYGADAPHLFRYYVARGFIDVQDRVVDAACSFGYGTNILARTMAESVIGLDYHSATVEKAKRTYSAPEFRLADLDSIKDDYPECDVTVSIETLEHLKNPLGFIKTAYDKTKKLFVVSTPIVPTMSGNEFHLHDWGPVELEKLVTSAGWKIFHWCKQGDMYGIFIFRKPGYKDK